MKKIYEAPEMEIAVITEKDVIKTSGLTGTMTGEVDGLPSYSTDGKW